MIKTLEKIEKSRIFLSNCNFWENKIEEKICLEFVLEFFGFLNFARMP